VQCKWRMMRGNEMGRKAIRYDPGPALTVAKMPVKNPPTKPATRCVWKTPRVSSTYLNSQSLFLVADSGSAGATKQGHNVITSC
jgi:hypothetical protein